MDVAPSGKFRKSNLLSQIDIYGLCRKFTRESQIMAFIMKDKNIN